MFERWAHCAQSAPGAGGGLGETDRDPPTQPADELQFLALPMKQELAGSQPPMAPVVFASHHDQVSHEGSPQHCSRQDLALFTCAWSARPSHCCSSRGFGKALALHEAGAWEPNENSQPASRSSEDLSVVETDAPRRSAIIRFGRT